MGGRVGMSVGMSVNVRVDACMCVCAISLTTSSFFPLPLVSAGNRVGVAAGGGGEVCEADPAQVRTGGKTGTLFSV